MEQATVQVREPKRMYDDLDYLHQAAALPVLDGHICLITSRNGKRWIIPKGCSELGKTSSEIALQEAWEEAGLTGIIDPTPLGSYLSVKEGLTRCVLVHLMKVTEYVDEHPENFRDRDWLPPEEAARQVHDSGLKKLIREVFLENDLAAQWLASN